MKVPLFHRALMHKISIVKVHCCGMELFNMNLSFCKARDESV